MKGWRNACKPLHLLEKDIRYDALADCDGRGVVRAQNASERVRQCWALLDVYLRYTSVGDIYLRVSQMKPLNNVSKIWKTIVGSLCRFDSSDFEVDHGTDHFSRIAEWHFTSKGKPTEEVRLLHDCD